MALFSKESLTSAFKSVVSSSLTVKILGDEGSTAKKLFDNAKSAVKALDSRVKVEFVTDPAQIKASGAEKLPAIMINDKLVSQGANLDADDIKDVLERFGIGKK